MAHTDPLSDEAVPFQIEGIGLRGRLVRLGPAIEAVLARHSYPLAVADILGETVALACALASGLKYDGVFILQTQGDGPVSLLVADVTSAGAIRAYARFDEDKLAGTTDIAGAPVPRLLGAGHLAFTVDQGPDTQRYQGITPLDGATLSECAHHYFRNSEQLESAIVLASASAPEARPGAAALMLQRMPSEGAVTEEEDEDWRRAVTLMSSVTRGELLDPSVPPADLLFRLFHEDGVRIFKSKTLRQACRCSREGVVATLKSIGSKGLRDLLEDGKVTVTCEFCRTDYVFDEAALKGFSSAGDDAES